MKVTVVICDRCGKPVDIELPKGVRTIDDGRIAKSLDLCKECRVDFVNWVNLNSENKCCGKFTYIDLFGEEVIGSTPR